MPLYEYECLECVNTFEVRRSFEQSSEQIQCPTCKGTQTHKVFGAVAFINMTDQIARRAGDTPLYSRGGCGCGAGSCGCHS